MMIINNCFEEKEEYVGRMNNYPTRGKKHVTMHDSKRRLKRKINDERQSRKKTPVKRISIEKFCEVQTKHHFCLIHPHSPRKGTTQGYTNIFMINSVRKSMVCIYREKLC